MIDLKRPRLSVVRQCALLQLNRSSVYYRPVPESEGNLELMRLIDAQFLETPYYGSRQMTRHLRRLGHDVGRKRVRRLMATMGLRAIYQKPHTTNRIMRIAIIRSGSTASERNTMLNLWANRWG